MTRDYMLFIRDIYEAAEHIIQFVKSVHDVEHFRDDEKTSSAVLRKLEVIGEAAETET